MIAMGAAGSSVAAHAITNVGLARFVAGLVFPVGLMMVILLGAELFTGDCLMAAALPNKDISVLQFMKVLILVYIGNFIGAALLVLAVLSLYQTYNLTKAHYLPYSEEIPYYYCNYPTSKLSYLHLR